LPFSVQRARSRRPSGEPRPAGTLRGQIRSSPHKPTKPPEGDMGRYALLWLLGVPIPILLLIYLFGGLH
jgi:hypothetical protein